MKSVISGDCYVYSKWKQEIKAVIDDISYTSGTTLQELDLPESSCVYLCKRVQLF